jgi:2-methylcitrate dehydratase PrpD
VAASLVLGHAGLDAFEERALADPRIRDLARRVEIAADPAMGPRRADYPTARVRVALRDGRALEESVTIVRGDALNPVPPEDVVAKFLALAEPVVGSGRAKRAVDAVNGLDAIDNVRDLAALCAGESEEEPTS